jgi:hypothetical protein
LILSYSQKYFYILRDGFWAFIQNFVVFGRTRMARQTFLGFWEAGRSIFGSGRRRSPPAGEFGCAEGRMAPSRQKIVP